MKIADLLQGKTENHLLPFFWQHGEQEEVLRQYVGVIQESNCNAFCVESRPHPDFAGPGWWHDMDIILDEAEKRSMKVWILDDSHFPTGYCNGALENADYELCRQSVFYKEFQYEGAEQQIFFDENILVEPPEYEIPGIVQYIMQMMGEPRQFRHESNQIIQITAYGQDGTYLDLTGQQKWKKPDGTWKVLVCGLTHNLGSHRSHMNMMQADSCRLLIEHVYEPHYAHYARYFGNTIAGFFSDEPELGNGILYARHNKLGTNQDLPWSRELEIVLRKKWGGDFAEKLPLLWCNDYNPDKIHQARVEYMDAVSDLVKHDFSEQVGNWCRTHGVSYIGHLIEDNQTHFCTGSGLGHYFRGLYGQDMAGIDDIGGQVIPGGEDEPTADMFGARSGSFYHYSLGKLGVSAAFLEPRKQGRTMCEIFGNYGWQTGVPTMKYLADHFMVRGVNYFVPHAFSPKEYPDSDCPPHFYAHGNNPQYRHFGQLCAYMNRVCSLINSGELHIDVAIYYNAESDWAGECMPMDEPARCLYDAQIDYLFLPLDEIRQVDRFRYVLVPYADYVPEELDGLDNVIYLEQIPGNLVGISKHDACVVPLDGIVAFLKNQGLSTLSLIPENNRVRCMHYTGEEDIYFFVNEGKEAYHGAFKIPKEQKGYWYYPWENYIEKSEIKEKGISLSLEPRESLIFVLGEPADTSMLKEKDTQDEKYEELLKFTRSICRAVEYPNMIEHKEVIIPDRLEEEYPDFSGFVRYETVFEAQGQGRCRLEITDADQCGIEVFLNGESLGIRVATPCRYDLSDFVKEGTNSLAIEVATTAERENAKNMAMKGMPYTPKTKSGICDKVFLIHSTM